MAKNLRDAIGCGRRYKSIPRGRELPNEDLPSHQGMGHGAVWGKHGDSKWSPAKRWVRAQVRRPWDKVHSELVAELRGDWEGDEMLAWLLGSIEFGCVRTSGVVVTARGDRLNDRRWGPHLYVDQYGILCELKAAARRDARGPTLRRGKQRRRKAQKERRRLRNEAAEKVLKEGLPIREAHRSATARRREESAAELVRVCPRLDVSQDRVFHTWETLLAFQPDWIRDLASWRSRAKGKSESSNLRSLVQHLLFHYPVPGFLIACFTESDTEERPHQLPDSLGRFLAIHVGQGGSPAKFAKLHSWRPKLTKRMWTELMKTPAKFSFPQAVRRAQLRVLLPGSSRTHKAFLASVYGYATDVPETEEFVFETMQWFANQSMLDPVQVRPLVDFIAAERERDPSYRIIGRSAARVLAQMERWHLGLASITDAKAVFDATSFASLFWTTKHKNVATEWAVVELLSSTALINEGRAMRHCVASYVNRVRAGAVSIWSLNCKSEFEIKHTRLVTIEVDNRNKLVRQARGRCNRKPSASEADLVRRWAARAGLRISAGVFD